MLPSTSSNAPKIIKQPRLLIVEGKDTLDFCIAILDKIGIEHGNYIVPYEGNSNLKREFNALSIIPGFRKVKVLAFIRDAEENPAQSALLSIQNILKENTLPYPDRVGAFTQNTTPRVGVFVMPDNNRSGMLEDLCWESVVEEQKTCIEAYLDCSKSTLGTESKNSAKSRVLAYLAALPEYAETIGITAKQKQWNFDHPCFAPIISFLREFAEGIQI